MYDVASAIQVSIDRVGVAGQPRRQLQSGGSVGNTAATLDIEVDLSVTVPLDRNDEDQTRQ